MTNIQAKGRTERQTDRSMNRKTDRQPTIRQGGRLPGTQTKRQSERQTDKQPTIRKGGRLPGTQTERQTDRQTNRYNDRQTENKQRERQRG